MTSSPALFTALAMFAAPLAAQTYAPAPRTMNPSAPTDFCAPAPQGQGSTSEACRRECARNARYSPWCAPPASATPAASALAARPAQLPPAPGGSAPAMPPRGEAPTTAAPAPNWGAAVGGASMTPPPSIGATPGAGSPNPPPLGTQGTKAQVPVSGALRTVDVEITDVFVEWKAARYMRDKPDGPYSKKVADPGIGWTAVANERNDGYVLFQNITTVSRRIGPGGATEAVLPAMQRERWWDYVLGPSEVVGSAPVDTCADILGGLSLRIVVANRSNVVLPPNAAGILGVTLGSESRSVDPFVPPAAGKSGTVVIDNFAARVGVNPITVTLWPVSQQQVNPTKNRVNGTLRITCDGPPMTSAPAPAALR